MRRPLLAALLAAPLLGALAPPARAQPSPAPAPKAPAPAREPAIAYQRFELANGLQVFVIEDRKAPVVHEVLWFRVGSKDEVAGRTGFAHLFEHLMFKGSTHLPDGLMDRLLEAAGGWSNAYTSPDATVYQNVASANFLEQMLWMESDRLVGLLDTFDQAKLDNQRDVVLNERRQSYENRPYGMASLLIAEALWPAGHGYHWSTIGYPEDLHAATVADVAAFFRTYYVPNNATLVIAGDVRFDEVKRLVEKYLGFIPRGATPARPRHATPGPLAPITREVVLASTDDVQVPKVFLAWRGPAVFTADEPALDAAAAVLGSGKGSRLYKRLVYDAKIAQDVEVSFYAAELAGQFEIEVTAKPGTDPRALTRAVTEEVAKLAAAPPTAAELERAKSSQEADFLTGIEPTLRRAIQLATYAIQARDPDYFGKDLARRRAVTAAQVQAAVAKYLTPTSRVVLTIRPGAKPAAKPARPPAPAARPATTPAKEQK